MIARKSVAISDDLREKARKYRLYSRNAKLFASLLANAIERRLKHLWEKVSCDEISWRPGHEFDSEHDSLRAPMHSPRRNLLFHVSAMFEVNECGLDFLNEPEYQRGHIKNNCMTQL